jgi:ribosomal protein S18 acetylase RimI-like enzyme
MSELPQTIRRAGEGDYAVIRRHFELSHDAHATHMPEVFLPMQQGDFSIIQYRYYLEDTNLVLIAELDGTIAGSLLASVSEAAPYYRLRPCRTMFIWNVVTEPAVRRRGIARSLVAAAAEWAAEQKAERIDLMVWSFNDAALALYREIGFADAYAKLTVKPSDVLARLGTGRLPKVSPQPAKSWRSWLRWGR